MAKKITFPNRPCPGCGKAIHIKTKKHEECGWVANGQAATPAVVVKRLGRPKKPAVAGGITLDDISAVKGLCDRIGAEKVRQLAQVLAK